MHRMPSQRQAHISPVVVALRVIVDVVAVPVALPFGRATRCPGAACRAAAHGVGTVFFIGSASINSGRIAGIAAGTWAALG